MHSRPRFLYALLVIPLLMGAKNGGKGCCGPKDVPDVVNSNVPDVTSELQVVSLSPSSVKPNQQVSATLYGAGFASGAKVRFGETPASGVSVEDENTIRLQIPALQEGTYDVEVANADGGSAKLRQGLVVKGAAMDCRLTRVGFDLDQAGLTDAAKSTLDANMACYRDSGGTITIEGHADERGTTEYNIALGERRAETVKRYLTTNGVQASRIGTVSYGEDRPLVSGHDESAWAQNRRAEIHVAE